MARGGQAQREAADYAFTCGAISWKCWPSSCGGLAGLVGVPLTSGTLMLRAGRTSVEQCKQLFAGISLSTEKARC